MDNLLIIDGHNLLFRMIYGIPGTIKNREGKEIKGTFGFIGNINKLIGRFSPNRIVVLFDTITSINIRLNEYEDYKQNRIDYSGLPEDENPFTQLKYIYKALTHLGIKYIEAENYEADDYIASICEKYKRDHQIIVISSDKDFLQLVDENVVIYNPLGKEGIFYDSDKVYEKYSIYPNQVIDYKILVGDKSDNILGVKGIGPKKAAKLLEAGSLKEILSKEKEIDEKLYNKLNESKEIIERNRLLVTMKRDLNVIVDNSCMVPNIDLNKRAIDILRECDVY